MSQKMEFVKRATQAGARMAVLCREYGISRETGYKWLRRYEREGAAGLEERSRRPHASPLAAAEDVVASILELREKYPRRGPKKLVVFLRSKFGASAPSVATVARVLKRFGMVRRRSKYGRAVSIVERRPEMRATAPNELWTVDFKGWWLAKDGDRCEPLTVRDAFSRFILAIKVLASPSMEDVRRTFESLFKNYGIPQAIQVDNGVPFINVNARGGLTRLSAWWLSLGIRVVRSRPGCPQDNGAHERMHRDMRAEVQAVPASSRIAEQRACDRWRVEFNRVRPHEALGGKTPSELYKKSTQRSSPRKFLYPAGWILRSVGDRGAISVSGVVVQVGLGLARHRVALEPMGGTTHRLWLNEMDLGTVELPMPTTVIDAVALAHLQKPLGRKSVKTKRAA